MGHMAPMVVEQGAGGERAYDIYQRLLKERIIGTAAGRGKRVEIVEPLHDGGDEVRRRCLSGSNPGQQYVTGK